MLEVILLMLVYVSVMCLPCVCAVDDGTGAIVCVRWYNSDPVPNIALGALVTVYGKVVVYRGMLQLRVYQICIHSHYAPYRCTALCVCLHRVCVCTVCASAPCVSEPHVCAVCVCTVCVCTMCVCSVCVLRRVCLNCMCVQCVCAALCVCLHPVCVWPLALGHTVAEEDPNAEVFHMASATHLRVSLYNRPFQLPAKVLR